MSDPRLSDAYRWCENLAHGHYENFPVASRLLPRRLRRPVAAIYAYARTADDLADEGDLEPETRLQRLDALAAAVEQMAEPPSAKTPCLWRWATPSRSTTCPWSPSWIC